MIETRYYEVAGHRFCVSGGEDIFTLMHNYEPFRLHQTTPVGGELFALSIGDGETVNYVEELRQEGEGQVIVCGHTSAGEAVFEFLSPVGSRRPEAERQWCGATAAWLVCSVGYRQGRLVTTGKYTKMAVDNALMVMFALATADKGTVLFHASVVGYKGRGYMFLGSSGTGKSTHASLWLRAYPQTVHEGGMSANGGAELVNDDNPVVRLADDGSAVVYGSPWSGKTPCYRNVSFPLGGIVVLGQAPPNKIRRLSGICAYAALVESISGKRWDKRIADGLHRTENWLASNVAMWHLECLPDEAAARLSNETIVS